MARGARAPGPYKTQPRATPSSHLKGYSQKPTAGALGIVFWALQKHFHPPLAFLVSASPRFPCRALLACLTCSVGQPPRRLYNFVSMMNFAPCGFCCCSVGRGAREMAAPKPFGSPGPKFSLQFFRVNSFRSPRHLHACLFATHAHTQLGPPHPGDALFKNPIIHATRTQ